ncbi:hypothetical protein B5G33_11785 [Blautia sp. An81]|nr:hypothetical protein B5G33_11785 [Blautia sp. An81]
MYVYPEELLPGALGLYRRFLWAVRRKAESGGEVFFLIGAMANDQIYNYVSDYMDGVITREQFWVLAKFKYPTHQINFCTKEALQCLKYRGYEEVK